MAWTRTQPATISGRWSCTRCYTVNAVDEVNGKGGQPVYVKVAGQISDLNTGYTAQLPLTITGVGTVTVGASQAGNGTWAPAPNVNQSFNVAPAQLSVIASNRSKTYGQAVTFAGTEFTTAGLLNSDSVTSMMPYSRPHDSPRVSAVSAVDPQVPPFSVAGNPQLLSSAWPRPYFDGVPP